MKPVYFKFNLLKLHGEGKGAVKTWNGVITPHLPNHYTRWSVFYYMFSQPHPHKGLKDIQCTRGCMVPKYGQEKVVKVKFAL
jgi:hypothetical protein